MRRLVAALVATAACALALAPVSPAAYRHVRTFGRPGNGPGEFGSGVLGGGADRQYDDPAGIAVAADGAVFVVDTSNNRVQEFSPTGAFRHAFGARGRDNGAIRRVIRKGRFFQPAGIALGGGQVFVIDAGNDRVMVHSARRRLSASHRLPRLAGGPVGPALGRRHERRRALRRRPGELPDAALVAGRRLPGRLG